MRGRRKSYAYFFILPGCLILLMFTILAAALAFGFSFMDFNLLRPKDAAFVGFENYIRLFQDASFLKAMKNTLYFAVIVVPYQVTLAFGLALLVRENIKGIGIFRSAYFSPLVTSMSVIAILWTFIYNPNPTQGLLNAILTKFGLPACDFLRSAGRPHSGHDRDHGRGRCGVCQSSRGERLLPREKAGGEGHHRRGGRFLRRCGHRPDLWQGSEGSL